MKTVGKEIIDGLNRGSKSAFAALYDSYFSYLCACAATYVPDPVSAEELVNDVFVNIWEHRGRYRVPLHGYLVNSVRNACISHIRSQLFRRRLRTGVVAVCRATMSHRRSSARGSVRTRGGDTYPGCRRNAS